MENISEKIEMSRQWQITHIEHYNAGWLTLVEFTSGRKCLYTLGNTFLFNARKLMDKVKDIKYYFLNTDGIII